jgi:hypothetical protein
MKTLIETKTGRVVNAGDVITLDGTAHILTDFDVPGLVGRGILTFACVDAPSKKDNIQSTPEVNETDIRTVGTDNDIDDYPSRGFISLFDPKNLPLKMIVLNWGMKMGLTTEDEIIQYASLIKAATPVGFLGVVLRELADEFNMYDTYQSHEWAFDYANCQIVKVDPHQMLYPENVVMFDSHQVLEHAIEICKELIDEICPDGK